MATKKKPTKRSRPQKAKTGRKDSKAKVEQDIKLRQLYSQDGITPWSASQEVHCGYEYAVKKFKEFGQELTDAEDENWIERQDKVRKRSLEGLSIQIKDAEVQIKGTEKRLEKSRDMQESLIDTMVENVQNTELGGIIEDAIGRVADAKVVMVIFKQLTNDINMWKNYGYLVEQVQSTLNRERVFKAELQMQYDGIEIMPPPSAVLEAEIEKHIASKNDLFAPKIPQPEVKP
ncbi:hypothetical protein LCGC14_0372320 [marine sediment metagenome]|uniref:Uncharacterized protein n=1 Tax=marine sediment metagenome TaxID=412755 RepID=A0A0F9VRT7_9ZZZZ